MRWRHEIATWNARHVIPNQELLQEALTALIDAHELVPDDASIIEHLGVLHNLRALSYPPGSLSWSLNLDQALLYFRQAAKLRPTSSYTWANIVLAKYRLGRFDAEFSAAMQHALDFGPWEPAVQLAIADAGLGAWEELDSASRDRMRENLRRAAVRQSDALAQIAFGQRRTDVICAASLDMMKNKVKCVK